MPTYAYRCSLCKAEHEALQKVSDLPLIRCPSCGQETLQRVLPTTMNFHLKGAGFYKNDYAVNKNQKQEDGTSSSTASPSAEKSCGTDNCGCH